MINLLPPKVKNEYQAYLNNRFMVFFGSAAIFILIIFMLLLGATLAFLKIQTTALNQQIEALKASEQNRKFSELNDQVLKLVQQYHSALVLDKQISPTLPIVEEIIVLAPEEIYLADLSFNRARKEIIISGFAPRREQVIAFQAGLENSEMFEKVISPLANLIKETDIKFNFTIILP